MVELSLRYRLGFSVVVVAVALTACSSAVEFIPEGDTHAPRNTPKAVQIFGDDPNQAFIRVGQLRCALKHRGARGPFVTDVLPELRKKAWEVGGDALIVRKAERVEATPGNWRLQVEAEVIRWR